jgi:truncated hemoglobin YjbI
VLATLHHRTLPPSRTAASCAPIPSSLQALEEEEVPKDVIADICKNVAIAKKAIFGDIVGGSRPTSSVARADQSLFARLGGEAGVGALVDALHERIQGDAQLAHVLAGVDMAAQRKQQLAFLRQVLTTAAPAAGGSRPPSGASSPFSISAAHLTRDKALTPAHFDSITQHLLAVLSAKGVAAPLAAELQALLGPGRCVLCPAGPAAGCPFAAMMSGNEQQV